MKRKNVKHSKIKLEKQILYKEIPFHLSIGILILSVISIFVIVNNLLVQNNDIRSRAETATNTIPSKISKPHSNNTVEETDINWVTFGPAGIPSESWNTAQKLMDRLTQNGYKIIEIDRWYNGGWNAHVNNLPFNNFPILANNGYYLKFQGKFPSSLDSIFSDYQEATQTVYNIYAGWNMISIPSSLSGDKGANRKITTNRLCEQINLANGFATEINIWSVDNQKWDIFLCQPEAKVGQISLNKGIFIKTLKPSAFDVCGITGICK